MQINTAAQKEMLGNTMVWDMPSFCKNERSVIKMMKVCITLWSLYIFQRGGLKPQFPKGLNYLMPVKIKYYQT